MSETRAATLSIAAAAAALLVGCGEDAPMSTPKKQLIRPASQQVLVETRWLADHVDDAGLRIVDVRSADDYGAGHIPGAVSIPRSATFDPDAPRGTVGRPEQIAALFGSRGIDETVHVVVYDEGRSTAAPRVFWTLEYYGHPRVSVLDGGFAKWLAEKREVTSEEPEVTPVTFTATPDPGRLSTKEKILEGVGKAAVAMLDARSPEEYSGEMVRSERGGHVPGAVNIDWRENFTAGEVPVFKSGEELTALYEGADVTGDKLVHAY